MVLEKLSGCTAESRIGEAGFADVRYVRAMLRQVLRAIDRAYAELGACRTTVVVNFRARSTAVSRGTLWVVRTPLNLHASAAHSILGALHASRSPSAL